MKIAVRNLAGAAYGGNPYRNASKQKASWDSLFATSAEILLVQEATGSGSPLVLPSEWIASPASALDRGSGSVVAARRHLPVNVQWRPGHAVLDASAAYLDFALWHAFDSETVLVSVHAPPSTRPEIWAAAGRAAPGGKRRPWSSDLVLDALIEVLKGREVILAGDWNEAPNFPSEHNVGTKEWFDRARRNGLVEVVNLAFGGPVRTNFTPKAKQSYQNDHIFMTARLADRVTSVAVWNEPPGRALSDHAGIIIELR
jgi:hypothetical protein